MRLSAIPKLALLASTGLFACSQTTGVPNQSGASGTTATSTESNNSDAKGGASSTTKKTSAAKGGSLAQESSSAKEDGGGDGNAGASSQEETEPASGGTATKTSDTKQTGGTSSAKTNTAKGGSSAGSAKGGSSGSGGTSAKASGTGGASGKTTVGTGGNSSLARGGSSATGGTKATTTTTTVATGGQQSTVIVTPVQNGQQGFTTRYWDCCKPSCGWQSNAAQNGKQPTKACGKDGTSVVGVDAKNACESGGNAFQCNWGAPWVVNDKLAYGYAAYNGNNCGNCYKLQFTGSGHSVANDPGAARLKDKQMIVQVINIGGIEGNQFDLLVPGGGVGAMNACTMNGMQWGNSSLPVGQTYGGIFSQCGGGQTMCAQEQCQKLFGTAMPALLEGCKWFATWFQAADNPNIVFEKTTCPPELSGKSGM